MKNSVLFLNVNSTECDDLLILTSGLFVLCKIVDLIPI